MKNGQKYAKEINQMVNQEYFECSLWSIRNGKRASEDCHHIPESFDPVSGRDKFCKKCLSESLEWLNQEYKEPVLDEVEKDYLKSVIRPFRNRVNGFRKWFNGRDYQIIISLDNGDNLCQLPRFPLSSEMYIGMDSDKLYTLQELGL